MNRPEPKRHVIARILPVLLLLILGLSWGFHFSILKMAAGTGLPYTGIIMLSTLGITAGMVMIAFLRGRWLPLRVRHLRFYVVCAALGYLVEYPLSLFVAGKMPAGLLAIIASTAPVFTSAIAIAGGIEKVSRRRLGAVCVGLIAAAIVLVPGTAIPKPDLLVWVSIAFTIPLLYAIYHNYVAFDWPADCDSWQVAMGEALVATIVITAFYVATNQPVDWIHPMTPGMWTIVLMAILAIVEIYLYFEIVRIAGAVFVSLSSFVSIVAGVMWGMVLFGEQHNTWIWASMVLLCLSLFLARERETDER